MKGKFIGIDQIRRMSKYLFPMIAIALFLSFFRLGASTLFDVDEAVFSEATREMVISQNWITPTYNWENRYDKPILFYWLMAASYKIFGINEFGARFPSALAAVLLVTSLFLFVNHLKGERTAFLTSMSAALSIYFLVYSRAAVTDMTLTLFITLSLFSFYLFSVSGKKVFVRGFYLFSALAFLTKGIIGFVFPFGIAIIYQVFAGGMKEAKKVFDFLGVLLFFAIASPWYVAEVHANGWEFIEHFFIKHHFRRFTGVISGHRGPFYYYIPVIVLGLFPWISFLPAGIRNVFKEKNRPDLFAFVWLVFIFLFFSLSTTKLPNYVLPVLPAASVLIGSGMSVKDNAWRRYSFLSMAILSALMGIAFIVFRGQLRQFSVPDMQWPLVITVATLAIAVLSAYSAFSGKNSAILIYPLLTVFFVILLDRGLPVANGYLQGTLHEYSIYAKDNLLTDDGLVAFRINNPSIVFYSGRRIITANSKEELASVVKKGMHTLVISKTKDAELLQDSGYRLIKQDRNYSLLER